MCEKPKPNASMTTSQKVHIVSPAEVFVICDSGPHKSNWHVLA